MTPELVHAIRHATEGRPHPPSESPWLMWLTIALCRQRARQDWLANIKNTLLNRSEQAEGEVPGHPLWSFYFHGRGLCFNGPNNEILDVDFYPLDVGPQTIDPHFFVRRIQSLTCKPRPEERVVTWFGHDRDVVIQGLNTLRELDIIGHQTSRHVFHLHPVLEENYGRLARVNFSDDAVWFDWQVRSGEAADRRARAELAFQHWALSIIEDRKRALAIRALSARLPISTAVRVSRKLMAGPVDAVTGRSIEALKNLGLSPGVHERALYERLDPTKHNPYSACMLAEWLMEDGQVDAGMTLVHRFAAQRVSPGFRGNPFDDRYATLALRFAPEQAPPLVERALVSSSASSLMRIGALLSLLDAPWCREHLLRATRANTDHSRLRFLVGCLMHSNDAPTREAAQRLLPPPPKLNTSRMGYTFEEVAFLNLREQVAHHRSRAQELADQLRPH